MAVDEGTKLWEPSEEMQSQSNLRDYMTRLETQQGLSFDSYHDLWNWSVEELEAFWGSFWEYIDVEAHEPYEQVLADASMPGAEWFTGSRLNFAEHVFRHETDRHPALIARSESGHYREIGWGELRRRVASVAQALREMGVEPGDRVVSYLPNIPHAVVTFLACSSLGAIWSSCSPDFGTRSVVDRFEQIEPRVLFCVDGYTYDGETYDRTDAVEQIREALPSLEQTVLVDQLERGSGSSRLDDVVPWETLMQSDPPRLRFESVPFDHPLWVVYSSGTTGPPKPIVHGHGGILMTLSKDMIFHFDLDPGDRFFWFTTTGWIMWNIVVGSMLAGATPLLYDGSPGHPDLNVLWDFAEQSDMTVMGTGAAYIMNLKNEGVHPRETHDLSALACLGSTGSPLPAEGFQFAYDHIKSDHWLVSISGGTDVAGGFFGGSPLLPVYAGEMQCRLLGVKAEVFDPEGRSLVGEEGELVITEPMPSMPIYFWNDPGDERYRSSYFEMYPGVWRHGDWAKITPRGTAIIYGRSDSTINRQGVRMGTSEIYSAVEDLPEVVDSLAVGTELPDAEYYFPLFVVLREGEELTAELRDRIKATIREQLSPRHVPDVIHAVSEIPRTLTGKKLEVPVKRIFQGADPSQAVNRDATENPDALEPFLDHARDLPTSGPES